MKTKTGYIYLIDGQVVVNPEREPDFKKFGYSYQDGKYDKAYAEWKANCIRVVNAEIMDEEDPNTVIVLKGIEKGFVLMCENGQKVEHINGTVTKIL